MPLEPMMAAARELPEHVQAALEAVETTSLPTRSFDAIVVCGMGGSSVGGALAVALLEQHAEVPLHVLRGPDPPGFVDEDTLVVATSYSGNTQETVDAAHAAYEAGAELAAVTTGGDLASLADELDAPLVQPPTGYQPRAAVGWLWAANHAILAAALGRDVVHVGAAADRLEERISEMALEGGEADELASRLGDGPVGVVGHDLFGVVARRWADALSENAKRLAFHAQLPEAAHNQIVGWDGHPGDASLLVVGREDEAPLEAARTRFLAERARKAGADVDEVRLAGSDLEAALEAVALGDLLSIHLARREGTDPEPVSVIDALKSRLAEALEGAVP